LREDIETEEYLQKQHRLESRQRQEAILAYNSENQRYKQEEVMIEREQDAILMDYAIRKEREAIEAEERKRQAEREAAGQYRAYLDEQSFKEQEDNAYLDAIRREEEEKVWKARDDALQAREDARQRLMRMVDEGRQEQIRYKQVQSGQEKEEDERLLQQMRYDNNLSYVKEQEALRKKQQTVQQNQSQLLQQMQRKQELYELQQQENYLEDKEMRYREKLHQQKLAQQAGTFRLHHPVQKNNWFS